MTQAPTNTVIVVGAGIVGLAIAQRLLGEGFAVTVVDRDPEGDKASFGNAGGIAVTEVVPASVPGLAWRVPGWLLDPLGPLAVRPGHAPSLIPWLWRFARAGRPGEVDRIALALAALNSRVYDDLVPMLAATGLSGELHRNGALTVYESEAGFKRDAAEWALKRAHGITVEDLTAADARGMEPALGSIVKRGVFTPQWSDVSDPKRLTDGLRGWLQAEGAAILAGTVVDLHGGDTPAITLADGRRLGASRIVVAAGAWSGRLAKRLGDKVLVESERGYNTTLPDPGLTLSREIIFAERKFVAVSLSCGLRIGGAAEFGGLNASANFRRSRALVELARPYLPGLKTENGREWAGHRPTTPDSLPVIGPSPGQPNIVYAFGHGHLGLTQAATTGRLVADLVCGKPAVVDLSPYAISRFS